MPLFPRKRDKIPHISLEKDILPVQPMRLEMRQLYHTRTPSPPNLNMSKFHPFSTTLPLPMNKAYTNFPRRLYDPKNEGV